MINDVSDAFREWLMPCSGERRTGDYVKGTWVSDEPTPLSFLGVVQVANEKDLKVLPEGERQTEAIKIHTTFDLINKDKIDYDNEEWLVYNVAKRKIGGYNKAIAILVK